MFKRIKSENAEAKLVIFTKNCNEKFKIYLFNIGKNQSLRYEMINYLCRLNIKI